MSAPSFNIFRTTDLELPDTSECGNYSSINIYIIYLLVMSDIPTGYGITRKQQQQDIIYHLL